MNRIISIAPMMSYSDPHFRMLARLLTRHTLLYTEMITTAELLHGKRSHLLHYNAQEHPLALQLGGSDPNELARCAKMGEDLGYDEVNLNVGCPSSRVQSAQWGACLMKQPETVAEGVAAMLQAVTLPVTVKTRIGVDHLDTYENLHHFVHTVASAGCHIFILHARKAWLQGLNPKKNRSIPPLRYETVYQLKRDFPELTIVINGGIKTIDEMKSHLTQVDGVMIGREAYSNPLLMASFDREFYQQEQAELSHPKMILQQYLPYVSAQLARGVKLRYMTRHLLGLFQGKPGAKRWRHYLSTQDDPNRQGIGVIEAVMEFFN